MTITQVLFVVYFSNGFLTVLQIMWGRLVIRNSLRVLGLVEKPPANKNKAA
eukprot:COSAG05_NODE_2396_length_3121_cov_2.282832_3_plen_51_part_00